MRYIRTNNPLSAYALHILQNTHDYGLISDTFQLLETFRKGTRTNCWKPYICKYFINVKYWLQNKRSVTPTPSTNSQVQQESFHVIHSQSLTTWHTKHTTAKHILKKGILTQHGKNKGYFNPNSLIICTYI
jgi:hypothetical protein